MINQNNQNNQVLRGNKYGNYIRKEPVDSISYNGDIFEKVSGNKVIGEYVDKVENVGKYGYDMYIIDSDRLDKKYDKIFSCKSLDRQMKEVSIGDIIEVEYVEYNEKKNYHVYKVSKVYYEN